MRVTRSGSPDAAALQLGSRRKQCAYPQGRQPFREGGIQPGRSPVRPALEGRIGLRKLASRRREPGTEVRKRRCAISSTATIHTTMHMRPVTQAIGLGRDEFADVSKALE
jgi:hypothetical protein